MRPDVSGVTVFMFCDSIVKHAVDIPGASFFTSRSVRQSNDCTVTRSLIFAARTASTTARAKRSGSGVVSPLAGVIFVSMLKRTGVPPGDRASRARSNSCCKVGMRSPSLAF